MRDTPEDCPGFLNGKWARNCVHIPKQISSSVKGIHTHFLIWWNKEYDYFSQTNIYRWLQRQHEQWTTLRIEEYHKHNGRFDAGEYYNTFKMDYMQQSFIIFNPKPPTRQFCIYNNPHPLFTFIQNKIDEQNPEINNMTMQYVGTIIKNIGKKT